MTIKIAHITTIDLSLRYLLLSQLRSLVEEGYEVVGISSPGPDVPAIEAAGIRHIPVPMTRRVFTPFADLRAFVNLYRVIRRERLTIVHTHTPKAGVYGRLAARLAGVPIIIHTSHGLIFNEKSHRFWRYFVIGAEKFAARCCDLILSVNEEDIDETIKAGICEPSKIHVQGGIGVNLAVFDRALFSPEQIARRRQELGIPPHARVVGFVGRLAAKRKGFLDFLAAGQRLVQQMPDAYFLIVGAADAGRPDAVEPTVACDYGIHDHCRFLGWRPSSELPLLYCLMDILVLPSLTEGYPVVVMEALAMQVPAVVSDVKGNREAVEHGRTGLLFPFGDVQALTQSMVRLLNDPETARRMGEQGRQVALERFGERLTFEKLQAEYARLLLAKGLPLPRVRLASYLQ